MGGVEDGPIPVPRNRMEIMRRKVTDMFFQPMPGISERYG